MSIINESHLQKLLKTVKKLNHTFDINLVLSFSPSGKIGIIHLEHARLVFNDKSFTDRSSLWYIKPVTMGLLAKKLIDLL